MMWLVNRWGLQTRLAVVGLLATLAGAVALGLKRPGALFAAATILLAAALLGRALIVLPARRLQRLAVAADAPAASAAAAGDHDPPEYAAIAASLQRAHAADQAMRRIEAMHKIIAENTADIIVIGNAQRRRVYVSPSYTEILGYSSEELLDGHAFDLLHPEDLDAVRTVFAGLTPEHPRAEASFRMRHHNGGYVSIDATYRVLGDNLIVSVLRDVTRQRQAEHELAQANRQLEAANRLLAAMAMQDGLTGLANRRQFDETLAAEFCHARIRQRTLALILIDADFFKAFNDSCGHPAGDECLRRISAAAKAAVRRPADLVARYGGEEIAILLPDTDLPRAITVAERIREAVMALCIEHPTSPHRRVTISVGVSAVLPAPDTPVLSLVEAADRALYEAKHAGRNLVRGHLAAAPQAAAAQAPAPQAPAPQAPAPQASAPRPETLSA
jgi:diguanylate cyclase (GGDEF)-like protein/PAS domain S-box-containing protein